MLKILFSIGWLTIGFIAGFKIAIKIEERGGIYHE